MWVCVPSARVLVLTPPSSRPWHRGPLRDGRLAAGERQVPPGGAPRPGRPALRRQPPAPRRWPLQPAACQPPACPTAHRPQLASHPARYVPSQDRPVSRPPLRRLAGRPLAPHPSRPLCLGPALFCLRGCRSTFVSGQSGGPHGCSWWWRGPLRGWLVRRCGHLHLAGREPPWGCLVSRAEQEGGRARPVTSLTLAPQTAAST